jgi:nucleoside-diphosphate-sugar epimerase/CBS domain-containing protein
METIKSKKIEDILVQQTRTVKEVMKTIDKAGTRTAIVIDDNNKLLGIVTDGDIRRSILNGMDITEQISKVMNTKPIYLMEETPKEDVVYILKSQKILNAPLVDKDMIVKDIIFLNESGNAVYFNNSDNVQHIHKPITRILVIGGGGYVGSVLVKKLLDKGLKVNVLDKFIYGKESLETIKDNPNLTIIEGDTRHIEDITTAIRDSDAVVHLAELVGDPACALDPKKTMEINCLATKIIASVCKHFQINKLVYASSCSVYGASDNNQLLTENSPLNPVSLYAKMKIASENALIELKDENFMPTILRLGTVFGNSYRQRYDLVVNLLTAKALRENKITVFGGDQWRPNVHVGDVADTIISVLESPIEKVGGEIFNVGHEDNNHTINKIGELIKNKIPEANLIIEERDVDKRNYKVAFTKLREALGNVITKDVDYGINEIKMMLEKNQSIDFCDKKYSNIKYLNEKTID